MWQVVDARLKAHIIEAKKTCLTLTKSPNMAHFLADFLNGCPNTAAVLKGYEQVAVQNVFLSHTCRLSQDMGSERLHRGRRYGARRRLDYHSSLTA